MHGSLKSKTEQICSLKLSSFLPYWDRLPTEFRSKRCSKTAKIEFSAKPLLLVSKLFNLC